MKKRILLCSLLLALAVLPVSARADVVVPGQKPPEPAPATAAFESLYGAQFVDFDTAYADALEGPVETALWLYPGAAEPETSLTVEDYPANALSPCYVDAVSYTHLGYDPVFFVLGLKKTFAELTPQEKNAVSHRGAALREFKVELENYLHGTDQ